MTLHGDVNSLNLASFLQDVASNQKTGTLTVRQNNQMFHLWFEQGLLRLVGLGKGLGPSILNGLLAAGIIPDEDLPEPTEAKRGEAGVLRKLKRKYNLSSDDFRDALAHQMTEHACEVFHWAEARFEFHNGEPDDDHFDVSQVDIDVRLPVDGLVMEALRRKDEWEETRRALVTVNEILAPDPSRRPPDADPTTARIFSLINAERSIRDIMKMTRLGIFQVGKAVTFLLRHKAVRPLTAEEALKSAQKHNASGRWESAIRLALYGVDKEPSNLALREILAKAYESTHDITEAVSEYRRVATGQLEDKKNEEAIATYRKVLALAPGDLYAHERLFDLLLTLGRDKEVLEAAQNYAQAAKNSGLPDKARDVYERLRQTFGEDEKLLENLADLQRHMGDTEEAVDLYFKLLALSLKRSDDTLALARCDTILRLAPKRKDVKEIRDRLSTGAVHKDRARRRRIKLIILGVFVAGVLAILGGYELSARLRYGRDRADIQKATMDNRLRDALEIYDAFLEDWPLSLAAREARPERELLEERYVDDMLKRAEAHEKNHELFWALEAAREARNFTRKEDLLPTVDARIKNLEAKCDTVRKERTLEVRRLAEKVRDSSDPQAAEKIALLRDPLALDGLRICLMDRSDKVRLAAIRALGAIKSDKTLALLMEALADPDPAVCSAAADGLIVRTGQALGKERLVWDRWFRLKGLPEGAPPTLQPVLELSRPRFAPSELITLEWRVVNIGEEPASFTGLRPMSGLTVTGRDGRPRQVTLPAEEEAPRSATLSPGEHIGGAVNLRRACRGLETPGIYRIGWRIDIDRPSGPETTEASSILLESVAPPEKKKE